MTNQHHPITPPPELLQQWIGEGAGLEHLATQAARWGADQQLNADCEWLTDQCLHLDGSYLRAAMRPKPPSLKEQALEVLEALIHGDATGLDVGVVRRALEALDD